MSVFAGPTDANGIKMTPHLTSKRLPYRHGFFGSYESLNAGQRSDDDPQNVKENRARICKTLGANHLISLHQVHSDRVVIAEDEASGDIEADGLVTTGMARRAQRHS